MDSALNRHPEFRILQTDFTILQCSFNSLHQSYIAVCKENACLRARLATPVMVEKALPVNQTENGSDKQHIGPEAPVDTGSAESDTTSADMQPPQRVSRRIYCNECEKSFSRNADLKRHRLSIHEKRKFTCDNCGNQFSRLDVLSDHKRLGHCKENHIP